MGFWKRKKLPLISHWARDRGGQDWIWMYRGWGERAEVSLSSEGRLVHTCRDVGKCLGHSKQFSLVGAWGYLKRFGGFCLIHPLHLWEQAIIWKTVSGSHLASISAKEKGVRDKSYLHPGVFRILPRRESCQKTNLKTVFLDGFLSRFWQPF